MPRTGSIQERAYKMLRTYILEFVLAPGTSFTIQDMAKQMEVSSTPVREALIRLQKDALVRFTPQRDTLVTKIDLKRIEQERFIREQMESAVLQQFMQANHNDAQEMQFRFDSLLTQQKLAAEKGDAAGLIRLDDEFHHIFYTAAGRELVWEMLEQYNTHYRRVRLLNVKNSDMMDIVIDHRELLEHIQERDLEKATQWLSRHLHKLDQEIETLHAAYPDYFVEEEKERSIFKLL